MSTGIAAWPVWPASSSPAFPTTSRSAATGASARSLRTAITRSTSIFSPPRQRERRPKYGLLPDAQSRPHRTHPFRRRRPVAYLRRAAPALHGLCQRAPTHHRASVAGAVRLGGDGRAALRDRAACSLPPRRRGSRSIPFARGWPSARRTGGGRAPALILPARTTTS